MVVFVLKKNNLKNLMKPVLFFLVLVLFTSGANAFAFNGTIHNTTGNPLNDALINIEIYLMSGGPPQLVGVNSTTSNASGWFDVDVLGNTNYMYKPVITHNNTLPNYVDYTGQSLPMFPYSEFIGLNNVSFYLKDAGTINITVINGTGDLIGFGYMIKDMKLGYEVSMDTNTSSSGVLVHVPKDRNYSIMVWPADGDNTNHFVPVSYEWTNFSATLSYNIANNDGVNLSSYNYTTRTLHKQFNITESFARVTGYINDSAFSSWSNFTIVPYVLEGGMIHPTKGALPYNASAWDNSQTDIYNKSTGFYNITLPYASAETVRYILFAAAENESQYMGAFRNITVTGNVDNFNFSLHGLLGTADTINMSGSMGGNVIIRTKKQTFNLINSSGDIISSMNAHIEIRVDYSSYDCMEFVFMEDISSSTGTFSLLLLDVTGIKEMNIYTSNYAPKKTKKTVAQITQNNNITMTTFDPGGISEQISDAQITISLYKSNSTCDVPNPPGGCLLDSSSSSSFNPLSTVIGGGALSFRISFGNITVHYKNVDLLASGPPDVLFDSDSNDTSLGSSLEQAWRFGSAGPNIYDEILLGIPYEDTVDESAPLSILLSSLYDEDWNVVWNSTANPNGENYNTVADGDYSDFNQSWMNNSAGGMPCSTSDATADCYVNTTSNVIWLKIPHFSGIGPSISSVTLGGVSANTTSGSYNCTNNCTVYINVTNNNYTLSQELRNVTINNTDVLGNVRWFKIYKLNASDNWNLNGTNSTEHLNYNFTLYNGTASTVHRYMIVINKTNTSTTQFNFTYNVTGMADSLTLSINLTCVENWNYSDWSACSGGTQTRTGNDINNCGTTTDRVLSQGCTSSSSGGGGGTPSVTYDEQTVGTLAAGSTKAVTFTKSATLAVTGITVTVKNKVTNAKIRVDTGSLPSGASLPSTKGSVYKYITITKTAMTDNDVTKAVIKFKVKKEWLKDKGYGRDTVALHRYYSNKWDKLETTRYSEDATYYHYNAESLGFSTFAITAEKAPVTAPEEEPEEEDEVTEEEALEEEEEPEEELEEEKEAKSNIILIVVLIAVIIVLAVGGYFVWKKKQN